MKLFSEEDSHHLYLTNYVKKLKNVEVYNFPEIVNLHSTSNLPNQLVLQNAQSLK